jgi:hypothetical protein
MLSFNCKWGWVVSVTTILIYIHQREQVPLDLEASWASVPVWVDTEKKKRILLSLSRFEPPSIQQLKGRYASFAILATSYEIFKHFIICLTAGSEILPKPFLHRL